MSQTGATLETAEQQPSVDAAVPIAAHLARTTYGDLSDEVTSAVKVSILDTLGCIIAGTSTADVRIISDMVLAWEGAPICTVIGSGGVKLPQ